MRRITAGLFITVDGVVESPDQWQEGYFNEEMGEAVGTTHEADVMLFGRVTYDSFAGAWPDLRGVRRLLAPQPRGGRR